MPTGTKGRIGYDCFHTAIDDYTRLAYSEVLPDEKDATCAGFLDRAMAWFAAHGVHTEQLLTDNALVYRRGTGWGRVCSAWGLTRRFTKPGCPSTWPLRPRRTTTHQPAHRLTTTCQVTTSRRDVDRGR